MAGYMEDAVKEKKAKSFSEGYSLFLSLAPSGIRRNNHIAEKVGVYSGKISFAHRK
jgi:hypothetical protein